MTAMMFACITVPLVLVLAVAGLPRGRAVLAPLPLAPLPALVLGLWYPEGELQLPGLLLGGVWMLDDLRRVFLLLTALVWLVAGIHAVGYMSGRVSRAFSVFWLLALSGNLGLVLAVDIPSFYSFFALMTFSAYGLVIHNQDEKARRAGRVYLVMAVLGEVLLLGGLLLAARLADSLMLTDLPAAIAAAERPLLPAVLLWLGFGVKASLPLLHFWLPLAHPAAPTPASAVLSGAMIKAGLLGWLLTLPLGGIAAPGGGGVIIAAGVVAALGGALIGVCQHNPKTVLAYSSISQMGLMGMLLGAALSAPGLAAWTVPAVALYALHHGLAKAALFLAVALRWDADQGGRIWRWPLVVLPGLALTGLPFTSGAASKLTAKRALEDLPEVGLLPWLPVLISTGAVATTILVLRFFHCLASQRKAGAGQPWVTAGWLAATAASAVLFWWLPWPAAIIESRHALLIPDTKQLWALSSPVLVGLGLAVVWVAVGGRALPLPPGDGVVWLEAGARALHRAALRCWAVLTQNRRAHPMIRLEKVQAWTDRAEAVGRRESGLILLAVVLALAALLIAGVGPI